MTYNVGSRGKKQVVSSSPHHHGCADKQGLSTEQFAESAGPCLLVRQREGLVHIDEGKKHMCKGRCPNEDSTTVAGCSTDERCHGGSLSNTASFVSNWWLPKGRRYLGCRMMSPMRQKARIPMQSRNQPNYLGGSRKAREGIVGEKKQKQQLGFT